MQELPARLVAAYASLFVHRWDDYAVQQRDGSYWRVAESLSLPLLAAHLEGRWTLGTYLLISQVFPERFMIPRSYEIRLAR